MTFVVDGGIEWEKDTTNKVLTIRPASSPASGYTSGQMRDFTPDAPWGDITETGWTLTLENGITNIGNYAFINCYGFTGSLTIPDSVTSIGNYAFRVCSGFTGSLTIGNSVTSIGTYAFMSCSDFTGSLTIPGSVTSIGNGAFRGCDGFTDVKFLDNQPTLGSNAFNLNPLSPTKTYDVFSNGWANTTTFPEYDYTKWNYISPGNDIYVKIGGAWKKGTAFVKVGGVWKEGSPKVKVGGTWK